MKVRGHRVDLVRVHLIEQMIMCVIFVVLQLVLNTDWLVLRKEGA